MLHHPDECGDPFHAAVRLLKLQMGESRPVGANAGTSGSGGRAAIFLVVDRSTINSRFDSGRHNFASLQTRR